MSAYRPTTAWVKRGIPMPENFKELWQAAHARDLAMQRGDRTAASAASAAFAHEFGVLAANARAEGYPPPTLVGWLDEETGEVQ